MKNFSKTITAVGLSILSIGAMAQITPDFSKARSTKSSVAKGKFVTLPATRPTHNVTSTPTNWLLDNLNGDEFITGGTFYNWSPFLYLNTKFGKGDTLSSNCSNLVTTVFDNQVWDFYNQEFQSFAPGTVTVDTITALVRWHNTSGHNDTVIFTVTSVSAAGYPTGTPYGAPITVVLIPGTTLPYDNNMDSIQTLVVPTSITVPGTARLGYNFGISMTAQCNKALDTVGLVYYSQGTSNCAGLGGDYTPEPSAIGVFDSAVKTVNTFLEGEWSYNSPGNHGNNTSLSWPQLTSPYKGYYMNSGGYYYAPLPLALLGCCSACTGDTAQFAVQDVGIFPSVSAVSNLGIDPIAQAGLSVAQNYPNPFNKETTINYSLTKSSDVTFTVYDLTGRVITTTNYGNVAPGQYAVNLSANTFSPGIYFYTFNVNGTVVTKKMVITE
jgi:hypothetical protein